jgi:hypothetical protein
LNRNVAEVNAPEKALSPAPPTDVSETLLGAP